MCHDGHRECLHSAEERKEKNDGKETPIGLEEGAVFRRNRHSREKGIGDRKDCQKGETIFSFEQRDEKNAEEHIGEGIPDKGIVGNW